VLGSINAGPIGGTKRNAGHVHNVSLGLSFQSMRPADFFQRCHVENSLNLHHAVLPSFKSL
jgi:hypothetical protein